MIFYYYCNSYEEENPTGEEDLYEIKFDYQPTDDWEWELLASAAAADLYSNHDGWEYNSWRGNYMEFWLYGTDKVFVGKYRVLLEYEPSFYARKVKS